MNKANESTEKITKSLDMIQSISDRTNLLPLNVAIEAVRAGESGRVFAVVADEIGKLAEQSAGFASEIKVIIDEMTLTTEATTETIQAAEERGNYQNEKLTEVSEKFKVISDGIGKGKMIAEKLTRASQGIGEKAAQIVAVIQNLSALAEENAASSEEVYGSIENQTNLMNDILRSSEELSQIA